MSHNTSSQPSIGASRNQHDPLRGFQSETLAKEFSVGRALAFCVYPFVAWPRLPKSWRLMMLTVYAAAGYVCVLGARFILTLG